MAKKENFNQLFEFDNPIPSIPLHSLKFKSGKWTYVYAVSTPRKLGNRPDKKRGPLYFSSGIHGMRLSDNQKKNMVNIPVSCKDDIIRLLNAQRESDMIFRKEFEETHESMVKNHKPNTFALENRSQRALGKLIVGIYKQDDDFTTFVGRP